MKRKSEHKYVYVCVCFLRPCLPELLLILCNLHLISVISLLPFPICHNKVCFEENSSCSPNRQDTPKCTPGGWYFLLKYSLWQKYNSIEITFDWIFVEPLRFLIAKDYLWSFLFHLGCKKCFYINSRGKVFYRR